MVAASVMCRSDLRPRGEGGLLRLWMRGAGGSATWIGSVLSLWCSSDGDVEVELFLKMGFGPSAQVRSQWELRDGALQPTIGRTSFSSGQL